MAALANNYMIILKRILEERFLPYLPPLLGNAPNRHSSKEKQLSRAFSAFVLHKLCGLAPNIAAAAVVDDFDDKGLDAVHYHEKNETLYLVQVKLKESEQFKQVDAHAFCEGVRLLLAQEFDQFNDNLKTRRVQIENAIDTCSHIHLVIAYTGDGVSQNATNALDSLVNSDQEEERLEKNITYYKSENIVADLLNENIRTLAGSVEIPIQKYQKIDEPRTTYYGMVKVTDLIELHQRHEKILYERNIRYFLGSTRSEINKSIKSTLGDNPKDFFYFNNGVTAVCDSIELKGNSNNRKLKVRGLSVINGAQTIASAAEFKQQNPTKQIDDARVMFTLIKVHSEGEFGKKVTKSRNHQNPVYITNFASLDEKQEFLRQEMAHHNYLYHYRPEANSTNSNNIINLDETIRALVLSKNDPRYPAILKKESLRVSNPASNEYKSIFAEDLTGLQLINTVLCERVIRELIQSNDKRGEADRLIYRHGILAITAVMLKRLRNKINANLLTSDLIKQDISHSFDELRQHAADIANSQMYEGALAFFRKQENVISFIAELMIKDFGLHENQAVASLRNISDPTDQYPRQRLFDYLIQRAPQI